LAKTVEKGFSGLFSGEVFTSHSGNYGPAVASKPALKSLSKVGQPAVQILVDSKLAD